MWRYMMPSPAHPPRLNDRLLLVLPVKEACRVAERRESGQGGKLAVKTRLTT
jgi:hypothetical protein